MAYEMFPAIIPNPDPEYEATEKPVLLEANFGDGYVQAAADGINSNLITLPLVWTNATKEEKEAFLTFLRSKGGFIPFRWVMPSDGIERQWVCKEWKHKHIAYNVYTLTATFTQDVTP